MAEFLIRTPAVWSFFPRPAKFETTSVKCILLFGKELNTTFQLLSAASLNLGRFQNAVLGNGLSVLYLLQSYCLKVKEMDDEEYSYEALQEPLYRLETGNYEYRYVSSGQLFFFCEKCYGRPLLQACCFPI